jgi:hypothetical protein
MRIPKATPDLEVSIAHLSTEAQQAVIETVHDAAQDGTISNLDVEAVILQAEAVQDHRENADSLQSQQKRVLDRLHVALGVVGGGGPHHSGRCIGTMIARSFPALRRIWCAKSQSSA